MSEHSLLLNSFDNGKLMDVVKNYKQYGYPEELRNEAIAILETRGIDELALRMTGNFNNIQYDNMQEIAGSYQQNSRVSFILYLVLLANLIGISVAGLSSNSIAMWFYIFNVVCTLAYLLFLIRSFINHNDFYKAINKELGVGDQLGYFLVGMPFYIFMYFFYKSQMKEELKMIQ